MAASPLVYPTGNFVPFTKILSSEVNGKFNAITTLLNTTKLSDTNLQDHGISWIKLTLQAVSQVAVTDTLGQLTVTPFITSPQGGTGFAYTPTTLDISKVLQVNSTGTALTLDAVPSPPVLNILSYYNFA